jgi:hypothetical protein
MSLLFNLGTRRNSVSNSPPYRFTPENRNPDIHLISDWDDPNFVKTTEEKILYSDANRPRFLGPLACNVVVVSA